MSVACIGILCNRFPMGAEPRDMGNVLSLSLSLSAWCMFQLHKTNTVNMHLSLSSLVRSIPQPPS